MKSNLLLELKKGLFSKNFFISILLSLFCFIISWHSWRINLLMHKEGLVLFYTGFMDILPVMAPIIVTLPYAASFLEDKEKYFLKSILIRESKMSYFCKKYLITGLLGSLAIVLPLFLLLILNLVIYPKGDVTFFSITGPFSEVFKHNQLAYALIIIINSAIFGFIYANIGLTVSFFIQNKVIAITAPFMLYMAPSFFFIYFNLCQFEPSTIFTLDSKAYVIVLEFAFLLITSIIAGYLKFIKLDKDEV